ncbi:M23 family metallopeptidase [Bacillus cihuensis]|uniref:M23 family metallopeptidase n=1 Tax=Bacillus cihuensis TaxID=1208599 RepID=UPI000490160D|nr:M23 family metallopeptidase [Bacillus cihuensis]
MLSFLLLSILSFPESHSVASSTAISEKEMLEKRLELFKNMETAVQLPWYYLAAADQYERSIRQARNDVESVKGNISIHIKPAQWSGALNPNQEDTNPYSISVFNGIGKDGNGDHVADLTNDEDLLFTFANFLLAYGSDEDNIRIGLWNFYKRDKAVGIIMGNAKLFKKFNRIDLQEKAFPVPVKTNYTYRSTWGVARGWGGRRSHEGTDIFAHYSLPVRATCYGIVEMKGWNKYGGWRIGIRDINNTYHYFAHLNGFKDGIKVGDIVKPGQVIGGVGSTGYGPPGTSGKFPPHLHFGMYKDNGKIEWSFDPTPHLRAWERKELSK